MSRAFVFRALIFIAIVIPSFYSCLKDKSLPVPVPYTYNTSEGFEGNPNLPSGWTLYNPDNDAAWQVVTTTGRTGTACVGFNNCSGNGNSDMTGKYDRLISPSYDLSKATTFNFSFDVAYALLNFKGQVFSDSLAVYYSIDGGYNWTRIYLDGGEGLSNVPVVTTSPPCWAPAATSDWKTEIINLDKIAGKPYVMFAFENHSGWGEWIYLDNISISASNGPNTCEGISYAKDIQPIIQGQCATSGCHVAGGTGPTDFSTYAGVKMAVDYGSFKKRTIDGNPSFMPVSGKLPDQMLSKIRCWLNAGAPNN